jgi:hypothetical protein
VDRVLLSLHLAGDGPGGGPAPDVGAALVDVGGVGEQVGHAAERALLADGQLEGCHPGPEPVAQLLEGAVEAGPLAVELVHEDDAG